MSDLTEIIIEEENRLNGLVKARIDSTGEDQPTAFAAVLETPEGKNSAENLELFKRAAIKGAERRFAKAIEVKKAAEDRLVSKAHAAFPALPPHDAVARYLETEDGRAAYADSIVATDVAAERLDAERLQGADS